MDIAKAQKLVQLSKDNRKILVTLWQDNKISTCVVEDEKTRYCETCQGDDKLCGDWIEYLKGKGYEATEIELAELELGESLPKFLEQRETEVGAATPAEPGERIEPLIRED